MKKLIILTIALASTASASQEMIIDGLLGAAAGAAIGNNVGDGDAETGAIIGGVTAVVAGEYSRQKNQGWHKKNTNSQSVAIVKQTPRVQAHQQQVQVKEEIWVEDEYVTDVSGNILYTIPGHYETRVVNKTITVYR
jgi:hypothetical protein